MTAARLADLPQSRPVGLELEGRRIALVRIGDEVFAVRNQCTHAGSRLDRGAAINYAVTCPMHGARFDVRTGRCINAPYVDVEVFPVRVRDGMVEVSICPAAA